MSRAVIVSGSNGLIGTRLIEALIHNRDCEKIYALSKTGEGLIRNEKITYIKNDDFLRGFENHDEEYAFVHLAFARAGRDIAEIADSLDFMSKILKNVRDDRKIKLFVYVSSQGVYGQAKEFHSETQSPSPDTVYGMAKYAGEKLVEAYLDGTETEYVSLRLDSVVQSQRLVRALCRDAISKNKLVIQGGRQNFSYIDADDAVRAISLTALSRGMHDKIYNVGHDRLRIELIEIAEIVQAIAKKNNIEVSIEIKQNDTKLYGGVYAEKFQNEFGWRPIYYINDMVERIFREEYIKK